MTDTINSVRAKGRRAAITGMLALVIGVANLPSQKNPKEETQARLTPKPAETVASQRRLTNPGQK